MVKNEKEWQEVRLGDIVYFNPTEKLIKGSNYKKVSMDCLMPKTRKIENYEISVFNGGSKFRNGDTLMARITPCLENGKTAQVSILDENEIAFGSTEFIVLREKENISDNNFVYYLFNTDYIRNIAIKSMTGTSGRQRVQEDVLKNLVIKLPPLEEQKKIASVLSSLDDKIELNNRMNKILEEMAQTIFKEWFVNFNFPSEEGKPYKDSGGKMIESELGAIPEGWKVGTIGDIAKIVSGKRPPKQYKIKNNEYYIPIYGASSIMGYTNSLLYNEKILITGRVGTHGIIQRVKIPCWASDNTLIITSNIYEYTYQNLKNVHFHLLNRGSTQPLITQSDLKNIKIIIADNDLISKFEKYSKSLFDFYDNNNIENEKLASIRDTLLPKLMSGEIKIK